MTVSKDSVKRQCDHYKQGEGRGGGTEQAMCVAWNNIPRAFSSLSLLKTLTVRLQARTWYSLTVFSSLQVLIASSRRRVPRPSTLAVYSLISNESCSLKAREERVIPCKEGTSLIEQAQPTTSHTTYLHVALSTQVVNLCWTNL